MKVASKTNIRSARHQRGVTSIEYALMGVLVALGMVVGASAFGSGLGNLFDAVAEVAGCVLAANRC